MKYRNIFGRIEYGITKKDGKYIFVECRPGCTEYKIKSSGAWTCSNAYEILGRGWWFDSPVFDSFIKAVKYLKENIDNLY